VLVKGWFIGIFELLKALEAELNFEQSGTGKQKVNTASTTEAKNSPKKFC
jgi:hypothetical protein